MLKVEYIKSREEVAAKVAELKVWLAQKEVVSYTNWKSQPENEKSRDAMDKVVSKLKLEDDTWLEKEAELRDLEPKLKSIDLCINSIMGVLHSDKYEISVLEELQAGYEEFFISV